MHNVHYLPPRASASLNPLTLRQTLQSWGGLLQWLPIGIYTCNAKGSITQFNWRAAELWGRVPDLADGQELKGEAEIAFAEPGFSCRLSIPLA